jgi:formate hydrogenlyase subunit 4
MVLDHGGPDFAFIQYGAALKLWVLGSLLVGVAVPVRGYAPWIDFGVALAGMIVLAVAVGSVESCMARLRLLAVPRLLLGALAFSLVALLLVVGS